MTDIIEQLNWRYATKQFDTQKRIGDFELNRLLNVINLSASSYGLQPYKVIVIDDAQIRKELQIASKNQKQVTEASHLILFAVHTHLSHEQVDDYIARISQQRKVSKASLKSFETMIKASIDGKSDEAIFNWITRQAYIALGFLLEACAIEKVDACPMEGFNNEEYDRILNLKEKGLSSVVMAAVGYRDASDVNQSKTKVRKTIDELVIRI